uniref:Uncharacterized protein n=1 Tax=Arundo donax TaxID=35708 RepID=A0A0A9RXK4_ARUDO
MSIQIKTWNHLWRISHIRLPLISITKLLLPKDPQPQLVVSPSAAKEMKRLAPIFNFMDTVSLS